MHLISCIKPALQWHFSTPLPLQTFFHTFNFKKVFKLVCLSSYSVLCHHSNLCCVCTGIFGDQGIHFLNVWTSTWGWISWKVAHLSLPLLNPSILTKKRYAAGHSLKWCQHKSPSLTLLFCFVLFFLFVKVSIIEDLVVGYESSLKSCRMFSEKGEYFCLLSSSLFFNLYI